MIDFDRRLDRWVVDHRPEWLDPFFIGLSWIGSYGLIWVAIALATVWWRRSWNLPMLVIAMVMLAEITNYWLKLAIGRDRPPVAYVEPEPLLEAPTTPSLPSGHATISFTAATLISFSVPRLAVPLFVLAALVAWSRVYVGVHYPLDIVAGAAYGVALAFGFRALRWLVANRWRSPRAPRPG